MIELKKEEVSKMTDIEKKQEKIIKKIAEEVARLDENTEKLDALNEDTTKKHSLKKWNLEKKMIHEIKKILHEAGKYEKYDEKAFAKEIQLCEELQEELA